MSVSEVRNTGLEDDVAPNKKGRIMDYDKQLAKYARQLNADVFELENYFA